MAVPAFGKLTPARLSEQIAQRIESLILDSQLRPEDKLPPERELAAQFGVSRSAVREAIKLLEERGLLESRNGRGAFVTVPEASDLSSSLNVVYRMQGWTVDHLHEARWCLESFVATLAAQRAMPDDIARLEAALGAMDASLDDPDSYMRADVEFHSALADATHNPLFQVMIRPLVDLIQDVGRAEFLHGQVAERHKKHALLMERIKAGDASGAQSVMRDHLNATRQAFDCVEGADDSH